MFLTRISAACTAPRVALLLLITVAWTLLLIMRAEFPLDNALQVATLGKAVPMSQNRICESLGFRVEPAPLSTFDGRKCGYSVADANRILEAMQANNEAGKNAYLNRHFPYDMVFPLTYGPAIAALLLFLLRSYGWEKSIVRYLALPPVFAAILDVIENIVVRRIVVAGVPADPDAVALASGATFLKYATLSLGFWPALFLLVYLLLTRSFRQSHAGVRG